MRNLGFSTKVFHHRIAKEYYNFNYALRHVRLTHARMQNAPCPKSRILLSGSFFDDSPKKW